MKRAVAYIRVSTASDAQVHSFEFQEDYWKNEINKNDDLTLVEIYADKGISGKSLSKRPELKRLLKDAEEHKFDVVYTKSVSRFAILPEYCGLLSVRTSSPLFVFTIQFLIVFLGILNSFAKAFEEKPSS